MKYLFTFALATAFACPVWAGDETQPKPLTGDIKVLDACLARTSKNQPYPPTDSRCVWEVFKTCTKATGDSSVAEYECYKREYAVWDSKLNASYKASIAGFESRAKDAVGYSEIEEKSLNNAAVGLRKAQRAWITYRDNACASIADSYGMGNGAINASWQCLTLITAQRALMLGN